LDYSAFTLPMRVFKQATAMTPLQFVTSERVTRAQQLFRAVTAAKQRPGFQTSRSLIEIALDVGYTSWSHFTPVFRRVVRVTPTQFRSDL
jgi:AraC family transcriptional regulator